MEQLKSLADLLDLHDIDLQIDKLLDDRGALPELEDYRVVHEDVARLERALTQARADLKSAELALDKTNGELETAAQKAAAEQNRLYAGGISARDADYLRREVDMLHGRVRGLEDDVLVYMEQRENLQGTVANLEEELDAATTVKASLTEAIQSQWRVIDAEIAAKEARKEAAADLVDDDLLEVYDGLRAKRKGRVVGRLADGICGACHLQLSAAEIARITKDDPPRCIHCRAILVV